MKKRPKSRRSSVAQIDCFSMLDELLNGDLADAASYTAWLEERAADGVESVAGVLRFDPRPRPWHAEWMTLCRASSFNGSL